MGQFELKRQKIVEFNSQKKDILDYILDDIEDDRCLPIIGPRVGPNLLLSPDGFADFIEYPLTTDRNNLAKVTQYLVSERRRRYITSKFLTFMKHKLFGYARSGLFTQHDASLLDEIEKSFDKLTFTEMATQLIGDRLIEIQEIDIYEILAELPLPIYMTTSHHDFLERALQDVGKTPHAKLCPWYVDDPEEVEDLDYEPNVQEPLVYHLHGSEEEPDSLVLSEDDHTRFLIALTENHLLVPVRLRVSLAESGIILLGYEFEDQAFKNIKNTILNSINSPLLLNRLKRPNWVQFEVDALQTEKSKTYIESEMDRLQFRVFWGTPQQFIYELYCSIVAMEKL